MLKKVFSTRLIMIVLFIGFYSCTKSSQKTDLPTKDSTAQKPETDTVKKSTNELPRVNFKIIKLTQVKNQDQRVGTDSETLVEFYINNKKADTYKEYGEGDLFDDEKQANLNSEMSEKIYTIPVIKPNTVQVNMTMIFEGEEKDQWTKTYNKNNSDEWKMTDCKGECE